MSNERIKDYVYVQSFAKFAKNDKSHNMQLTIALTSHLTSSTIEELKMFPEVPFEDKVDSLIVALPVSEATFLQLKDNLIFITLNDTRLDFPPSYFTLLGQTKDHYILRFPFPLLLSEIRNCRITVGYSNLSSEIPLTSHFAQVLYLPLVGEKNNAINQLIASFQKKQKYGRLLYIHREWKQHTATYSIRTTIPNTNNDTLITPRQYVSYTYKNITIGNIIIDAQYRMRKAIKRIRMKRKYLLETIFPSVLANIVLQF